MNLIFILIALTKVAVAMPNVGDKVSFVGFAIDSHENVAKIIRSKEIMEFREQDNDFRIRYVTSKDGDDFYNTGYTKSPFMMTDTKIDDIMKNCLSIGGKKETIKVPAGTFDTCHILAQSSIWYGYVPFGIVKLNFGNWYGATETTELSSFTFGP